MKAKLLANNKNKDDEAHCPKLEKISFIKFLA